MASIRKTVLTPVKWASKKILNHTLLRFPGNDPHQPMVCAYCPEMCRFSCPTAVASGNDAVTPRGKMSLLYKEERWPGRASGGQELWPIYDCTGCGRCTEYCVYEQPVAVTLFKARGQYQWAGARDAARNLPEEADPVGDLAAELGDFEASERRFSAYVSSFGAEDRRYVDEPKSLHFLSERGVSAHLSWEEYFFNLDSDRLTRVKDRLAGRRWLVLESPWLSRRLKRSKDVDRWCEQISHFGVDLVRPYARGRDCIDNGGEGAFADLFGSQAATMARDLWERDKEQADGILCFSDRAAAHFRRTLGAGVPVISFGELAREGKS